MLSAPVALCAGRLCKSWSVSTIQGRREEQEDRYAIVAKVPGNESYAFFGVYDGHGGPDCARYAASTLHEHVLASAALKAGNVKRALSEAFSSTEAGFLQMAHERKLSSGTTALTAMLRVPSEGDAKGSGGELTVAHVGDSRAVLCRSGRAIALTVDHKPEDTAERERIERAGGFVTERGYCMRVQGVLAMSRALGNRLLKPFVSAIPTVTTIPLSQHDEFFVLASDGLYDVFENQRVVDLVKSADKPEGTRLRGRGDRGAGQQQGAQQEGQQEGHCEQGPSKMGAGRRACRADCL
jgi:protein phosphatase 1L